MKKILVTGGSGFIGNHLCRKLLNNGNYVICLDNNFTGSIQNIADLKVNPNFEFIRHDITTPIYIEVDEIYHLACPASPRAYQFNGIKTIKTNILGTIHALGIAKRGLGLLGKKAPKKRSDFNYEFVSPNEADYIIITNRVSRFHGVMNCFDLFKGNDIAVVKRNGLILSVIRKIKT